MADGNELLIKISADAKNVKKAFDDIRDQTEDLEKTLSTVAKVSAIGFAALTAEVGFSLKAFAEAEAASRTLSQALQAQGIYTKDLEDQYKSYAQAVQASTGIDDDAVTASQAVAQGYLGQTKITKDLTMAIADFATAKKIDLASAAELIGKTIGTETNALARQGLQLDETATKSERFAKTLEFLQGRYSGQAAAANEALGGVKGLETAFGNMQEGIGSRFAPAAEKAIEVLTQIFTTIGNSEEITNLVVALIAAGLAVTALGVGIPLAVTAFTAFKAAMIAAGLATTTTKLAVNALVGATGIGLLVVAVTELALHWDSVWPRVVQVAKVAVTTMTEAFGGFGKILSGVFSFDLDMIKEGLADVKSAFSKGVDDAFADLPKKAEEVGKKQNEALKVAADKRAAEEEQEQKNKIALAQANQDLILLQLQKGSAQQIELKKLEIDTLKQLTKTNNEEEKELLRDKLDSISASEAEQMILDAERRAEFTAIEQEVRAETNTQELTNLTVFQEQRRAQIEAGLLTDQEVEQKILNDGIEKKVKSNNTRLENEKKYGVVYAAIHSALNSDEVQGFKSATGELQQMTRSKHMALYQIGLAAAKANIIIKTAESAMSIYAGFSTIPIVGPVLGVAGAAAAIAFGAEQLSNLNNAPRPSVGAAQGGLITGGIPNKDSVSAFLTPGELVVPTKNFEEVVSSVQMSRSAGGADGAGGFARVVIELKDDLMDFIETKLVERTNLGISLQRAT